MQRNATASANVGACEMKFTALDLKRVALDGAFTGYACLFGREDLGRDCVMPGAFKASLEKRPAKHVKMLLQHDPATPIGVWDIVREDQRGLYVEGRLSLASAKAREILGLMRDGAIDGLSIGFQTVLARRDRASGVRRLLAVDLWEISVVTFPMQPGARIDGVKRHPFARLPPTPREFERWLTRDAGLTRTMARAVMRDGLKGLHDRRDADGGTQAQTRLAGRMRALAALLR
ncbi:MAG: HK97 family phage prohead protease [Pseudomonadota bacterium]